MPILGFLGRVIGGLATAAGLTNLANAGYQWWQQRRQRRQQVSQRVEEVRRRRNPLMEYLRARQGLPPSIPENPLYSTASEVANWPRRFQAVGVQVPQPEQIQTRRPNLLQRTLQVLDPVVLQWGRRAGTLVGSLLTDRQPITSRAAWRQALQRSVQAARDPSQTITGQDVIARLAEQGNPLAQRIQRSRLARGVLGFAYDVLTDPVTYVTAGQGRVAAGTARAAPQAARRIFMVEPGRLVRTTIRGGRRLSPSQRAQRALRRRYYVELTTDASGQPRLRRLLPDELPRDLIRGRTTTQTNLRVADRLLAERLRRLDQRGMQSIPPELVSLYERRAMRQATRRVTELIPQVEPSPTPTPRTQIRIGGVPVLDLTPVRTAAGALVQRLPAGVTRVIDRLGRTFNMQWVPLNLPAQERAALREAQAATLRTVRATAARQSDIIRSRIRQWREEGLTPELARLVPQHIERTLRLEGPTSERAVQLVRQFFAEQVERLHAMGVPVRVLSNYVPHLYENPAQARQAIAEALTSLRQQAWQGAEATRSLASRGRPTFLQRRFIKTLEEAERRHGLRPIRDARVMMAVYEAMVEQVRALREISQDLVRRKYIVSDRPVPGFKQVLPDDVLGEVIPELRGKYIHPEIDRLLSNVMPLLLNRDDVLQGFLHTVNHVAGILKTLWLPLDVVRFNMQQLVGNVTLNWADGVWNPLRYTQAALVLTERGRRLMPTIRLAGRDVPTEQVYKWFREAGLEGTGRASTFRTQRSLVAEAVERARREDLGTLRYYLTTGRGLQALAWKPPEAIDNLGRMANFLEHLARGEPVEVAAEATRRALGDYSMLSKQERAIRTFVWFYPWMRFAIPRVIERLVGAPGLLTGWVHLQSNAIRLAEDQYREQGFGDIDVDRLLPDWAKERGAVPIGVAPDGTLRYILLDVPINELSQLPASTSPVEWMNYALQQVPPMTLLAPYLTGTDPLTGQPITEAPPGSPQYAEDWRLYAASQLGPLGRLYAQTVRENRQLAATEAGLAQGEVPSVPPNLRPQRDISGVTRTIHPSYQAATQLFQARDYYRQLANYLESQGIPVPETEDVRQGDVLGNPLLAFLNERRLRHGLPPIASRQPANPLIPIVVGSQIARMRGDVPGFIYEAMRLTGVGEDWAPFLNYLMRTSSGGDVVRIGDPMPNGERPMGAFQIPPSVFRQYAAPGMTNPLNPLHNAVAFIRFVQDRYGHPANMPELLGR